MVGGLVATIILAAGLSRRFGSDKLQADLGGKPLVRYTSDAILGLMREIGVADVRLVVPPDFRVDIDPDIMIVTAADHADGLSASLRAGVASLPPDADAAFIFLADMPFPPGAAILKRMIGPLTQGDAVRPSWQGRAGHPVLMGRDILAEIPRLTGDGGAKHLIAQGKCVLVEADDDGVLFDIDMPEDLAAASLRRR